jgi:hypothetical protein
MHLGLNGLSLPHHREVEVEPVGQKSTDRPESSQANPPYLGPADLYLEGPSTWWPASTGTVGPRANS